MNIQYQGRIAREIAQEIISGKLNEEQATKKIRDFGFACVTAFSATEVELILSPKEKVSDEL